MQTMYGIFGAIHEVSTYFISIFVLGSLAFSAVEILLF